MNELDILEYTGEDYSRLVSGAKWTVAALNYAERFDEKNIVDLERHNLTDEAFVLLAGEATLLVGEKPRRVKMEPLKVYNVRAGVWHNIFVSISISVSKFTRRPLMSRFSRSSTNLSSTRRLPLSELSVPKI